MVRCAGCNQVFSLSGLSKHYGQTQQLSCLDARDALYTASLQPPDSPSPQPVNTPGDIEVFSGDYFGGYQVDNFDMEEAGDPDNVPLSPLACDGTTDDEGEALEVFPEDSSESDSDDDD
ncbi:hypothetical protein BN946_scf185040.g6 [Trametes cinnabarina]|uniref:Uncharacterized protein n=1 Tax=Pycnoporus cinnabarinus TaxID=5643 RepID=A0A060SAI5_PYCCI|nr:hypothetical protein BN946_scf185040.g6 [Trametes cinnabarina]